MLSRLQFEYETYENEPKLFRGFEPRTKHADSKLGTTTIHALHFQVWDAHLSHVLAYQEDQEKEPLIVLTEAKPEKRDSQHGRSFEGMSLSDYLGAQGGIALQIYLPRACRLLTVSRVCKQRRLLLLRNFILGRVTVRIIWNCAPVIKQSAPQECKGGLCRVQASKCRF